MRTDRFGFIIPDSARKTPVPDDSPRLPDSPRAVVVATGGVEEEPAPPRPHEGPPPSSFTGLVARHTEFDAVLTEKDRKDRRARMMLENLRIKKWTDMFNKWDTCVCAVHDAACVYSVIGATVCYVPMWSVLTREPA